MLVATGWWPPDIPFDGKDLNTVIEVLNKATNNGGNSSRRR